MARVGNEKLVYFNEKQEVFETKYIKVEGHNNRLPDGNP